MQPEKPSYMSVLLREHLTVAISAFLVTFAAIKIIIFSLGNLSIALAVLNAGQQFTILASTMFSALVVGAVLLILIPTMVPIVSTLSEKERHRILNIYSTICTIVLRLGPDPDSRTGLLYCFHYNNDNMGTCGPASRAEEKALKTAQGKKAPTGQTRHRPI